MDAREDESKQAPLLVDAREACRLLGIGRRLLWVKTNCGDLPVVRIGRRTLYSVEALRTWIERQNDRSRP